MQAELYLDTARLGRMCDEARRAEQDFATLVSLLGSSLYLEDFLFEGFAALPESLQDAVPGLRIWNGISELSRAFRKTTFGPAEVDNGYSFLCSQSRTLISIAAESLVANSTCVLCTDLAWPPYLALLQRVALKHNKKLHIVPLKDDLLTGQLTACEVIARVANAYERQDCASAFLEPVSYMGIGIPIRRLVNRLRRIRPLQFLVLDVAQTIGHKNIRAHQIGADLVIGGSQKWLRAYHPLRFGTTSVAATEQVQETVQRLISDQQVHDPLLQLSTGMSDGAYGETVNVLPLITAAAAIGRVESSHELNLQWHGRLANAERLTEYFHGTGVNLTLPKSLRTGIALLSAGNCSMDRFGREKLLNGGVVASGFQERVKRSVLRVSMPDEAFTGEQLRQLNTAVQFLLTYRHHTIRRSTTFRRAGEIPVRHELSNKPLSNIHAQTRTTFAECLH